MVPSCFRIYVAFLLEFFNIYGFFSFFFIYLTLSFGWIHSLIALNSMHIYIACFRRRRKISLKICIEVAQGPIVNLFIFPVNNGFWSTICIITCWWWEPLSCQLLLVAPLYGITSDALLVHSFLSPLVKLVMKTNIEFNTLCP